MYKYMFVLFIYYIYKLSWYLDSNWSERHREERNVLQYNDDVIEDTLVDNVKLPTLPTLPLISSFVFIFDTTGATSRAGTVYISEALEFTSDLVGSRYSIFSFMCMFCRSLFVLVRCIDSDYPCCIFKLFFENLQV
jgi:hypothetical protein